MDVLLIAITTIINLWSMASYFEVMNWLLKLVKLLRMIVSWITTHLPEFNVVPNKTIKVRPRLKRRMGKYRRYIFAKIKGKQQNLGNKMSKPYRFLFVNTMYYTCSSTSKIYRERYMIFDSDSHVIGVDNHASRTMSNNINHLILAFVTTPSMIVKDASGNLQQQ